MADGATTVDEYVSAAPTEVREILQTIRRTVHEAAPAAEESISYTIPTFSIGGRVLIHVAAWKRHISVYPAPVFDDPIDADLEPYRAAKATVRFPLKKEIPYALIGRLVAIRLRRQTASPT
jgi:uncharacterized protein YdhG (YjbR/CyaY superfamily)